MLLGAVWNPGAAVANCSCDHFKLVHFIYIWFKMYIKIHVLKVPSLFKHFLEMGHPL